MTASRYLPVLARGLILAGLAVLAGCTNRGDETGATLQTLDAIRSAAGRAVDGVGGGDAAPQPQLTRAVLDTLDDEFLQAEVEKSGSRAFLYIAAERNGRQAGQEGGRLLVWRTENDVTLTLRDGVLVSTRGLGDDLISAQGGPILASLRGQGSGQGAKRQVYSALDNKAVPMDLVCAVDNMGAETIVIVERRHVTRHLRETCELQRGGTVVNDFWVDSRGSTVWRSRQWAGPYIGYITTQKLTP